MRGSRTNYYWITLELQGSSSLGISFLKIFQTVEKREKKKFCSLNHNYGLGQPPRGAPTVLRVPVLNTAIFPFGGWPVMCPVQPNKVSITRLVSETRGRMSSDVTWRHRGTSAPTGLYPNVDKPCMARGLDLTYGTREPRVAVVLQGLQWCRSSVFFWFSRLSSRFYSNARRKTAGKCSWYKLTQRCAALCFDKIPLVLQH